MKRDEKKASWAQKNKHLLRPFLIFSSWTGMSRLSGVVREILIANIFGASTLTDIYSIAIKLPNFFRRFFAEGALNAVLVPKFSELLARGDKKSLLFFVHRMFSVLFVGLFLFVLFIEIAMPGVIWCIAPGFRHSEICGQLTHYARITFPYIFFISLVAFMSGLLNSFHKFAWSAAISIIVNAIMIVALLIGKLFHLPLPFTMHLLTSSILVGGFFQCVIMERECKKADMAPRFVAPKLDTNITQVLKNALPGMVGAGIMQINIFVDVVFASSLSKGSVSYLNFADRLNQLPLSLIGASLGVTLLPVLSKHWSEKNYEKAHETQKEALVFGLALAIPAAVGLFVLADRIISLLYGHGKFDQTAILQTTPALKAFVCGLPAYILTKVFLSVFFANRDTRTPVVLSLICVFVNGTLNAILKNYYAHVGIAAATALSSCLNALLCFCFLYRRQWIQVSKNLLRKVLSIFFASFVMGAGLWKLKDVFPLQKQTGLEILTVGLLVGLGIMIYAVFLLLLKKLERKKLKPVA
ncbi:putative lipid II flippase MurJ [Alphaproteobacteria bacterium]|nr:putative lipid II flippase MurJ [Alphaproteobacteria bacterium]